MLTKEQRNEILRILPDIPFDLWVRLVGYLDSITVPEGWQVVPVEPTREMLRAVDRVDFSSDDTEGTTYNVWNAMLASAPRPGGSNDSETRRET